ncbi:MAG TPA: pirin family protein [Vicinamibacteria bacterium]|nr:pirin family protein [Vicinamibacteria bacterium]
MLKIRRAEERGRTDWGWLDSRHTFSFGDYHDPAHMGFRSLRVLNDDRVRPGAGFATHAHRDMEILSYVLDGALAHKDSSGGGGIIRAGEIQFMRAGTGVTHSEYNHSRFEPVHFLQMWIVPDTDGLEPTYDQQVLDRYAARRDFLLVASSDGRDASLQVQQDMDLWLTLVETGDHREFRLRPDRSAWVHIASGSVSLNGIELEEGDGAAASEEQDLKILGRGEWSEVLLFDLA